jgi:hypothetical protein
VVNSAGFHPEAGKARLGCAVSVLVLVVGVYFGFGYFAIRYRFYQIQDEVKTQATFASALDDATIRQRLVVKSEELRLPLGPRDWTVRRGRIAAENRRTITIAAEYQDSMVLDVPGFRKVWYFTFRPGIENHVY